MDMDTDSVTQMDTESQPTPRSSGAEVNSGNSSDSYSDRSSPYFMASSNSDSDYDDQFYVDQKKPAPIHPPTILHWVRMSSLRCHDNEAMMHAVANPHLRFRAVFIIDPWFATKAGKMAVNRLRFLLECLHDLDNQLKQYNTRLYVAQGQPVAVLDKLCKEWNVSEITFQIDREIRANVLESAVERLADYNGIKVTKYEGHTLYNINQLMQCAGKQITTIRDFKEILPLIGSPLTPVDMAKMPETKPQTSDEDSSAYRIPTLQQLGVEETLYTNVDWIGGESEALRKLVVYCMARKQPHSNYVDMLFDKTALSPYIRFGCLSVRYLLWRVKELSKTDSSYEHLLKDLSAKLLTREFYMTVAAQVPNFDSYNNSVSLHLPWEEDSELLKLWKEGKTGFPWIDAAMRQLNQEGYIHNCLRESVATFLTRGDLWMKWSKGKDVFEEMLLDFEPSVSCGCWMKSSCSAFFTGPVEHYCPMTYGQKMDPAGKYVRAYVPELRRFPDKYIYTPWMAPTEVQEAAGCRIGVDYPSPVVDHTITGALCCEKLRSVMNMFRGASTNTHQQVLSTSARIFLQAQQYNSSTTNKQQITSLLSSSSNSLLQQQHMSAMQRQLNLLVSSSSSLNLPHSAAPKFVSSS